VPGATHYTVFWGKVDGEYTNLTDSTANSIIINGLAQNERYALAVTAWNERGESDYCEGPAVLYDNDPGRAGHHLTKGSDLMERGQYQEAYQHISAAIQLAPDSADGYRLRGLLYEKLKRSDLARLDYEAAERILKQKPPPEKQSIALQRAAERRQNLFDPKLVR
jgi:tetratricopeptide (TPR) repeat protein